jgi:hypothetical protein
MHLHNIKPYKATCQCPIHTKKMHNEKVLIVETSAQIQVCFKFVP